MLLYKDRIKTFARGLKKKGISYDTAWRMWNRGQLQGERLPTGTIIIFEDDRSCGENKVAIYA
ncbi:MAG: hypothetical protein O9295_22655, partial [Microcystis sp. LE18-22.4A]|nr:hypothetical protein [Microcystis sp. LE18-22.4A]